ncbi:MAG: sensor histidine kinase, partial [Anaerolineales bacterium]
SGSLQKVNELRELRTSVTHLRKDGSRIFVEAHTSTLLNEDGRVTGYVSINHDITERKKAEQELRLNRDRLRSLSQRLVEVQEEERRAIANELHDRVGQSLSALNINLTIMRDQLSADALQRIGPRMNDSMQLAAEAITLVRDVMSDLRPAVLDDYGLEAALRSYVDQFKSRYGITILFEKPAQPILRMSPSFEMTFLRIAQEALLNIARHARADQINLSLWQDQHAIRLVVQDNGTGIQSWQEANRPGSHGLTIMRERADAVGGSLRVQSVPGKGTKVEVSIPSENVSPQTVQKERPA